MTRPRSLWLDEALARPGEEDAPALSGDERADVCIVGGGYTGLWTALRIRELEPAASVIVVESDVCGGGASGRNGGLVLSWWTKFATLRKRAGTDEALRMARASAHAVSAIGDESARLGIDAGYRHDGYLWVATNVEQVGSWTPTVDELARLGEHPFEELPPDRLTERTGTRSHVAGVFEASGAIVQPALLARGLRRAAVDRGIRIFEHTPMTGLDRRAGGGVTVRTPAGSVRAGVVVLAMNSWAVRFRAVRRHVLVIGSDVASTPPIPDRLAELGWTDGLGVSDSRLLVHYYRTTADRRIVFGKGGGALALGRRLGGRFEGPSRRVRELQHAFRVTFPSLGDVPLERTWGGPIDRTRAGLPFFGPIDGRPDVLVGAGYSGNGVGPSYLGGRVLASLALGRDDEWSGFPLAGPPDGTFPPEPFRWGGGHVVRAAIARKERRDDEGRRVGSLTRGLVRLAPAGLVPVKGR
ncbi:MAG TPA: FAD-binding oxidoreductase [Actinomycetota bacterium]|nr:FAD-binding oxidoreductase [Actinomycetota bacterium]